MTRSERASRPGPHRRRRALLVAFIAFAAACGDGSDPGDTAEPQPVTDGVVVLDTAEGIEVREADGTLVGAEPGVVLREEPLLVVGSGRALAVEGDGRVLLIDATADDPVRPVTGIEVPEDVSLLRDIQGGGRRFTIAQAGDIPYLVDLGAAEASELTTVTSGRRRVQGWRFSPDEEHVASVGTALVLVPTGDPDAGVVLAPGFGCQSIDADGRLLLSETSGEIGTVVLTDVDDLEDRSPLFAGATKCATWWGERIVASGTSALVELTADGATTELLDLEPGEISTQPVAGHPELVSVSGGLSPNGWFWLTDTGSRSIPSATGGRWVDVVGDTAAFAVETASGLDVVVDSSDGTTSFLASFPVGAARGRVLGPDGTAYLLDTSSGNLVVVDAAGGTVIAGGVESIELSPGRTRAAVVRDGVVEVLELPAGTVGARLGEGRVLAWLAGTG